MDPKLSCRRLSAQASIEASLSNMLPEAVQVLGIAWNWPRYAQIPPKDGVRNSAPVATPANRHACAHAPSWRSCGIALGYRGRWPTASTCTSLWVRFLRSCSSIRATANHRARFAPAWSRAALCSGVATRHYRRRFDAMRTRPDVGCYHTAHSIRRPRRSSPRPWRRSSCRRADTIACCASPERSPISSRPSRSTSITSKRPCGIGHGDRPPSLARTDRSTYCDVRQRIPVTHRGVERLAPSSRVRARHDVSCRDGNCDRADA